MLIIRPLQPNQHTYRAGYSTKTALYSSVYRVEKQLEKEEISIGAFLDVKGPFNRTSTKTIGEEARKQWVLEPLLNWLGSMLNNQTVEAVKGSTRPQGQTVEGARRMEYLHPPSDAW